MTSTQKLIATYLLNGGNIAKSYSSGYRLRTSDHRVVLKFHAVTFAYFKDLLRKNKKGLYLLDKNKVRQLHGSSWIKQQYYTRKKHDPEVVANYIKRQQLGYYRERQNIPGVFALLNPES